MWVSGIIWYEDDDAQYRGRDGFAVGGGVCGVGWV